MQFAEYGAQNPETIILLHGGGLSWWNYREIAQCLEKQFHVILPILDGHAGSDAPFVSIEENAARIIRYIDRSFDGRVLALGGLSLGGQIAAQMLTQRPDICRFSVIESALVKPMKLTRLLVKPVFGACYGLIKQKWFVKLQAAYLGIPGELYDDYYRDTCNIRKEDMIAFLESSCAYCADPTLRNTQSKVHIVFGSREQISIKTSGKLLHELIPGSTMGVLPGFRHGEFSLKHPEQYAKMLLNMIR